ncbi:MAG: hypothetical protein ACKO3N_18590 [Verrucomicrobiota bacterium]
MSEKRSAHQACLVLSAAAEGVRLWTFGASRQRPEPAPPQLFPAGRPLPASLVEKAWPQLMQPRLQVAWLPADAVCLQLVQLPAGDPAELPAMVELQLDKISPLPAAQVCWTTLTLPNPTPGQQTVVVTLAPREAVDRQLEALEALGYRADRLEVPLVRELETLPEGDGLWLRVARSGPHWLSLVAWRTGGVVQEVAVWRFEGEPEAVASALVAQLTQAAWAAEASGWLAGVPAVWLRAEAAHGDLLEPALSGWSGRPVQREEPPGEDALAARSAEFQRTRADDALLPAEVGLRYRQDFIDRLWTRGLGGLGLAYLVFVLGFLAWLNWRQGQLDDLRVEVRGMGQNYTNTLALRAQVQVLEEQVNLRYAALDCWKATVEKLPVSLTLTTLTFGNGRTLTLQGTAAPDAQTEVTSFNTELQGVQANGQRLFAAVEPAKFEVRGNVGIWTLKAELQRTEGR